jgi:hypothetical protein
VLPKNIPNILLPPAFFTALFWVALLVWALGIVSIYVARIYVIKKYNAHIYADIVTHIFFPIGMSDIMGGSWITVTDHSITRTWNLVDRVGLLSEGCKRLQRLSRFRRPNSPSTVRANWICIRS